MIATKSTPKTTQQPDLSPKEEEEKKDKTERKKESNLRKNRNKIKINYLSVSFLFQVTTSHYQQRRSKRERKLNLKAVKSPSSGNGGCHH